jgi:hypothetical protein
MKMLFLISTILVGCCRMIAQPPTPGSNEFNNYINKFEGIWQWVNGSDTLTIRLKKFNTQYADFQKDVLMGTHKYVQNGIVIQNSMDKFDSIAINHKKNTVFLTNKLGSDTSKVRGSINDLTQGKINILFLQYVDGTPPTIIWHLETAEGVFSDPNFQYGLTMPKDIILTKQ